MGRRIGRTDQIRIYVGKCWRLFINEKQWKNLVSTVIIMGLISIVTSGDTFLDYRQTRNSCFAIICACIWIGLFNSIQSICREREIIKREHRTGLHISSYVLAHVVFESILCLAESVIVFGFVLVKNWSNLPEAGLIFPAVIDIFFTIYLTMFAADMVAVLVSCIVRDTNSAMTVMPFVLIVQLIMAGVVFELEGLSDKLSNLTVSKWGLNGLMSVALTTPEVADGRGYFLLAFDMKESLWEKAEDLNLAGIWLIMLVIAVVCILLSVLFLSLVDRDRR